MTTTDTDTDAERDRDTDADTDTERDPRVAWSAGVQASLRLRGTGL